MRVLNDEPADWNQARTVYLANLTEIVLHGVLKKIISKTPETFETLRRVLRHK